jgi:RNA polymerase sigma-70 factor, ECF subfamily
MNQARSRLELVGADTGADEQALGVMGTSLKVNDLVNQNIDFVWRMLRRLGVPPDEVDDATQQVFLIANDKMRSIRMGSERAFLIAVATRVASHARRAYQRREAAKQRWSEHPRAVVSDLEHVVQRLEARDLLDRVLDSMPLEVRTVFVMFEMEDLSVDDVARLLELPRGTVASRLRRSRVLFKEEALRLKTLKQGGKP